jgi:hypothetical protein
MPRAFIPSLFLLLVACGDKAAPVEAAPEAAPVGPKIPDDAQSHRFAEKLMALQISDWAPDDSGDVEFKYTRLTFNPDNTWVATGYVAVIDERVDCKEVGSWQMDPAESETTANMTWTIEKTTCPGREAGRELRLSMSILANGQFKVKMR